MTQANLLQLAQMGDADAIAALMNASLQVIGVSARAVLRDGSLHVLLESERVLSPSPAIEFIRRGLSRLDLGWISSAVVYSRQSGQRSPMWVQQVPLRSPAPSFPPLVLDSSINPSIHPSMGVESTASIPFIAHAQPGQPLAERTQLTPYSLALLLSLPMVFMLSSTVIWFRFLWSGETASVVQPPLRSLLQVNQKPAQADKVQQAMDQGYAAYQLGQTAATKQAWRQAANRWEQAIALLQSVPKSSPEAAIAQQKLTEYQGYLRDLVRDKLSTGGMELVKTITGALSPKSVVHSGTGLFFAQNMMYNHSITVYDRQYNLLKTIPDQVKLSDYGYTKYLGTQQGAPVEAAFSPDGQTAWVSNYQMYGAGFASNADDQCSPEQTQDPSYLYRIGTQTLSIDRAVQVGSVPKYVATTPNNRYVLVSNWCSWDVSVIDPQQNKEIKRIQLGPYPRGIAVDHASQTAYVAVMGSYDIATINLQDFSVNWLRDIGHSPRHLNLDPKGKYLYATLNGEGQVAKIDLPSKAVVGKAATGSAPRSMAISGDGEFLYVVNYDLDTVSKVRTSDMAIAQTVSVNSAPIGITYDNQTHQVWVACYSGSIQVFQD